MSVCLFLVQASHWDLTGRLASMTSFFRLVSTGVCVWMLLGSYNATAADKWVRVQSSNFVLVGNASERDIRKVATQLEQFRLAFSKIFTRLKVNSSVPTVVIVFKNNGSFRPYKPLYNGKPMELAGFFQSGQDVNYIALTSEFRESFPFATVFHEYVHFLTDDFTSQLPVWVAEGLAEYYSTFEMSDGDRKIWLGKAIPNHILLLRQERLLPLSVLLTATHDSPYYNEKSRQGVFYAESWALIHYLMIDSQEKHRPQFVKYLSLMASGKNEEESFRQAFQQDYAAMEKELKAYIQRNSYTVEIATLSGRLETEGSMESSPLAEPEAQAYLGDFLLHYQRLPEAETLLKAVLETNPNSAAAHASMGLLCMRDKRLPEARKHLERAVALDSRNYLVHYHYAEMLSRGDSEENVWRLQADRETVGLIRSELKKAIEQAPQFLESYRLLAYVSTETGEDLEEALSLLQKAQKLFPGKEEIALSMAEIYLRQNDLASARPLLEAIARKGGESRFQGRARNLLEQMDQFAGREVLFRSARPQREEESDERQEKDTSEDSAPGPPRLVRKSKEQDRGPESMMPGNPARTQGQKVVGTLTSIECSPRGLTFLVKSQNRTLRFFSDNPEEVLLFSKDMENLGTIEVKCGPYAAANTVLVTYRAGPTDCHCDGEPISITFDDAGP